MAHPMFFSACAFLMLMLLISWVGYRLIYKPGRFLRQLGQPVITDDARRVMDGEPEGSTLVTVLHQIGSRVPTSEAEVVNLKADLIRAGFRSENALPVFYGIRIVSTLLMLAFCIILDARVPSNPVMKIGLLGTGVGAGWILPRFLLEKKVT